MEHTCEATTRHVSLPLLGNVAHANCGSRCRRVDNATWVEEDKLRRGPVYLKAMEGIGVESAAAFAGIGPLLAPVTAGR